MPSRLGDCVFVDVLQNVSNVTGKAHQAYLAHIVRRWDNLNNVTAFLKDSNVHSFHRLASLQEGIAFTSLSADGPPAGRRGQGVMGLTAQKIEYGEERKRLFLGNISKSTIGYDDISLKNRYVSFRSVFAASARRIREINLSHYQALLRLVNEGHDMHDCDDICAKACPNCEILERLWSTTLLCGDRYSQYHKLFQKNMWNIVRPRSCFHDGGPLVSIRGAIDTSGANSTICLADRHDAVIGIHLAGLLRWDILLEPSEKTPSSLFCRGAGNSMQLDAHEFLQLVETDVGLNVLFRADRHKGAPSGNFPCEGQRVCKETVEDILERLGRFEGQRIIIPAYILQRFWRDGLEPTGASFIKTKLMSYGG